MKESAAGYYIDFYVYPAVLIALPVLTMRYVVPASATSWLVAALVGLTAWSLIEYLMHRYILHNVVYFKSLHDSHHNDPKALIDTPIYVSFAVLVFGVLTPAYLALGACEASGFAFGMTFGYMIYSVMHHAMHFWSFRHDGYLYRAKHRHALHHYSDVDGNFGVTTPFWDYVFRTALPEPQLAKQHEARGA